MMLFPKSLLLLCWLTPVHLGVATCLEVLAQANNNAGDGLIMHQACNTVTVMLKADRTTARPYKHFMRSKPVELVRSPDDHTAYYHDRTKLVIVDC